MSYAIILATVEDIPQLTSVFYDSFGKVVERIFPSTPAGRQWLTDGLKASYQDTVTCIILDTSSEERKIVAWARWLVGKFDATDGAWKRRWQENPPEGVSEEAIGDGFFDAMARQHKVATEDRPHYFLEVLCCLPDHRGRGLAGQLLKWGNDHADEKGLECYLDAAKLAEPLYEKWGYEHQAFRDPKSTSEPMRRPVTVRKVD